jgi:hypothetical protein
VRAIARLSCAGAGVGIGYPRCVGVLLAGALPLLLLAPAESLLTATGLALTAVGALFDQLRETLPSYFAVALQGSSCMTLS